MMWAAGTLAALSSLSYPAISALISCNADSDQQGMYRSLEYSQLSNDVRTTLSLSLNRRQNTKAMS